LTKGLSQLKPSINVTQESDEDPCTDGTKNNQKKRKRNSWDFKPMIILNGDKIEMKGNRLLILKTE
jgi:hypothetical protein